MLFRGIRKKLTIQGDQPDKLLAVKLCRSQIKERQLHDRSRSIWKICTAAMTAIAIVAVVAAAIGVSVATCGIAAAVATSAIAVLSGSYRLYQKKQDLKPELGNVKEKELNDIEQFVMSDESGDASKNSERVKLYKDFYDNEIFNKYASRLYSIEENKDDFIQLKSYLGELKARVKNNEYGTLLEKYMSCESHKAGVEKVEFKIKMLSYDGLEPLLRGNSNLLRYPNYNNKGSQDDWDIPYNP